MSPVTRWIATDDYRTLALHACDCVSEEPADQAEWAPVFSCPAHRAAWTTPPPPPAPPNVRMTSWASRVWFLLTPEERACVVAALEMIATDDDPVCAPRDHLLERLRRV